MQLTIDGANFDVLDAGRGPAIVLLHGFPLAKEIWDEQAQSLAAQARIVRYDLRGLGATTATGGPYLMEQLAGDLVEILDALGIERAAIVGHSLGGYVALAFFRMFAERCLGLGFVCSRAGADSPEVAASRLALADRVESGGIAPVLDAYIPRYFAPSIYAERPDVVERISQIVRRTDPRGAAAMLRGMAARVGSEDLFEEMKLPVAVVAGAQDVLVTPEEARIIADSVPGSRLDVLECGHSPFYETPQALTGSLQHFAASIRSEGT